MTEKEMLVKHRYSLLQLAQKLNNIRKACNNVGVSRTFYYKIKAKFDKDGINGLRLKDRKRPDMPNQTEKNIEEKIINFSLENPSYGKDRIAIELRLQNIWITPSGVDSIWNRNNMQNRKLRIKKLEEKLDKDGFVLNKEQIEILVLNSQDLKEKHVISYYPGYLLCQDTFEVGYIKGIGKIYMQTVIDTYGSFGFAKLYTTKCAITAADILVDRVLPYYNSLAITILHILTDNGREYCGDDIDHDYELLLNICDIKHRRTKVRCPQTNGFVERFNRTVMEEFFISAFRRKWYYTVNELQKDLDDWLLKYNFRRAHQGYRVKGRTPAQVLLDCANRQKLLSVA